MKRDDGKVRQCLRASCVSQSACWGVSDIAEGIVMHLESHRSVKQGVYRLADQEPQLHKVSSCCPCLVWSAETWIFTSVDASIRQHVAFTKKTHFIRAEFVGCAECGGHRQRQDGRGFERLVRSDSARRQCDDLATAPPLDVFFASRRPTRSWHLLVHQQGLAAAHDCTHEPCPQYFHLPAQEPIHIGKNSNVQDGATLHTDPGYPLSIGENVTVGHMVFSEVAFSCE